MDTPQQRALARARAHAQRTLEQREAAPGLGGDYWAGALAEALRILLDATEPEGGQS